MKLGRLPYNTIQVDFLFCNCTIKYVKYTIVQAQKDDDDRRIDSLIRKILPALPLHLIYKNIRTGFIRLNGKKTKIDTRVRMGDRIYIASILYEKPVLQKTNNSIGKTFAIDSVFKNEHLWIIAKPVGIAVQKAKKNEQSLDDMVRSASVLPPSLSFSPGPLHRLDRNTSGILCFSQSLIGARWFSKEMQNGNIRKFYIGLAQGTLEQEEKWEDGIEKNGKKDSFYTVKIVRGTSITKARPLAWGMYSNIKITLIAYEILGGKTHQIRAQTAHHGYCLLGDTAYGGFSDTTIRSFYLHAYKMTFPENELGIKQSLTCPLPQKYKDILEICLPKTNTALILEKI